MKINRKYNLNFFYKHTIFFIFIFFITIFQRGSSIEICQSRKCNFKNNTFDKEFKKNVTGDEILQIPKSFYDLFNGLIVNNVSKEKDGNLDIDVLSDFQSSNNDGEFIATGNVEVRSRRGLMLADNLIYNRNTKLIFIEGNIKYQVGSQFMRADTIEYNLETKKGFILNAYGSANFKTLSDDLYDSKIPDYSIAKKEILLQENVRDVTLDNFGSLSIQGFDFNEKTISNTNSNFFKDIRKYNVSSNFSSFAQKWRFQSEKIEVNELGWESEVLSLTNDPYNKPQIRIDLFNFKSREKDDEIILKSKWSKLIIEDTIPVPLGRRRVNTAKSSPTWGIKYDKPEKDGWYILRNFETIEINNNPDHFLNLQGQYLIQRNLAGQTESFPDTNQSVLSNRVINENNFLDIFGLEASYENKISDWQLEINSSLNSLDLEKIKHASRLRSKISKKLYEDNLNKNNVTNLFFFGDYRDKTTLGSLGEVQIFSAYGVGIKDTKFWDHNEVKKSSEIGFIYGDYLSGSFLNSYVSVAERRFLAYINRRHEYSIWSRNKEGYIDSTYEYTPNKIKEGLGIASQADLYYFNYSGGKQQTLFTLRGGPQLILGGKKKKIFDYTEIGIYPSISFTQGSTPFNFDQVVDKKVLEFTVRQQLYGPLILTYQAAMSLDEESQYFKQIYSQKTSLTWSKRSYGIEAYYTPDNKTGGISFYLNNLSFKGSGKKFK